MRAALRHTAASWSARLAVAAVCLVAGFGGGIAHADPLVIWSDAFQGTLNRGDAESSTPILSNLARPHALELNPSCEVFFSGYSGIKRTSAVDASPAMTAVGSQEPEAIALSSVNIFYADYVIRKGTLPNTSGGDPWLPFSVSHLRSLALDEPNGKIYWLESGGSLASASDNMIRRANLDGSSVEDLVAVTGGASMDLDLANGKIYWADNYLTSQVKRSNLDGTNIEVVRSAGFYFITQLAVAADGIYVLDLDGTIKRLSRDGASLTTVRSDIGIGSGITVLPDDDGDGKPDCTDLCPADSAKTSPGVCGCGVADTDADADGTPDCNDSCPADAGKTSAGACGCGTADTDTDSDGTANCLDSCTLDPAKTAPGSCGCGVPDIDTDSDGFLDCNDGCPSDPAKTAAGACGCGLTDTDSDGDGILDCNDTCPLDPAKGAPGTCGCGVADTDTDSDGTLDCADQCPADPYKTAPGACGCGMYEGSGESCAATRRITKQIPLAAPDLEVKSACTVALSLERFSKEKKAQLWYRIVVKRDGVRKPLVKNVQGKSKLSLKLGASGEYTVTYQAYLLKNGRVSGRTAMSREAEVTVSNCSR